MTLEELAAKTGLSVSYLSRLQSGKRSLTTTHIATLSKAMRLQPAAFLSDNSDDNDEGCVEISALRVVLIAVAKKAELHVDPEEFADLIIDLSVWEEEDEAEPAKATENIINFQLNRLKQN